MEAVLIDQPPDSTRPSRKLRMTQRRVDANRRNATRSTGPRTVEGKAKVRLNALRHGFRARDDIFLAACGEEAARTIAQETAGLVDYFHAVGPEENALAAEAAKSLWKSRWAFAIEMDSRWWEKSSRDPDWPRTEKWLYALMRYSNRADRVYHRCSDALLKAANARRPKIKRTKPLARIRVASALEGGHGGRAGTQAEACATSQNSKIERTNPLTRERGSLSSPAFLAREAAAARQRRGGEGPSLSALRSTSFEFGENERTNPLEEPVAAVPNSLRALTFRHWERDRRRARSTQWQNERTKPLAGIPLPRLQP